MARRPRGTGNDDASPRCAFARHLSALNISGVTSPSPALFTSTLLCPFQVCSDAPPDKKAAVLDWLISQKAREHWQPSRGNPCCYASHTTQSPSGSSDVSKTDNVKLGLHNDRT